VRTFVGASVMILLAVAGSVTFADSRDPADAPQPVTAPTVDDKVVPATSPPPTRVTSVSLLPMSFVRIP
jgi:hypothetical protein